MIFDRQQLETFAVVVEQKNFGSAAKELNVTRGAVSQRIIALKEALGTLLLVRDGNIPTPAGEALLRHVQALKLMEAETLGKSNPIRADCQRLPSRSTPIRSRPGLSLLPVLSQRKILHLSSPVMTRTLRCL